MDDQQTERLDTTGLSRWDAAAFRGIAVIAVLGGLLSLWFGVVAVVQAVAHDTVTVPLPLVQPLEAEIANPAVLAAQAGDVSVTASGIGAGARAALAAGAGLGTVVAVAVAGAIALFLWRLAQGRPFHRSLFGATLAAGAAMSIGGLLSGFASGFGAMQIAFELDPDGDVFVPGFTFDPAVMAAGAVVLALAFVFRAGTRLQRDTEGLV